MAKQALLAHILAEFVKKPVPVHFYLPTRYTAEISGGLFANSLIMVFKESEKFKTSS